MAEKDLAATLTIHVRSYGRDCRPLINHLSRRQWLRAWGGLRTGIVVRCGVAGENARFGLPEITLGIMPGQAERNV